MTGPGFTGEYHTDRHVIRKLCGNMHHDHDNIYVALRPIPTLTFVAGDDLVDSLTADLFTFLILI